MSSLSSTKKQKGFTLVELMVSIGIMLVITSTVLFNQSRYSSGASLKNNADDISLSLRQAQVYGTGVKEITPGSNNFASAYGIEVNITPSGSRSAYVSFADLGGVPQVYDGDFSCSVGGGSECLSKVSLNTGNTISQLCSVATNGPEDCSVGKIDISFLRPLTDARIIFFDLGGSVRSIPGAVGARIKLQSVAGDAHSVTVYNNGQISVQ